MAQQVITVLGVLTVVFAVVNSALLVYLWRQQWSVALMSFVGVGASLRYPRYEPGRMV